MPGYNGDNRIELSVVWRDEQIFELETTVITDEWRGRGRAYTQPLDFAAFGDAIERFVAGSSAPVEFTVAYGGIGSSSPQQTKLSLRVYEFDAAGHCACRVEISEPSYRPTHARVLSVDLVTERSFLERFGREVVRLAHAQRGTAVLVVE